MNIKVESCSFRNADSLQPGLSQKTVLPGEVDGVNTIFFELDDGISRKFITGNNRASVFLFTKGNGSVLLDERELKIEEVALFAPGLNEEFQIASVRGGLGFLQLALELSSDDYLYLEKHQPKFPYFTTYSDCKRYREAIKSEKTINRTLLPEDVIPRLCLGSVETTGPDQVAVHSHPMLEQYFFGLPKNNCVVLADNAKTDFTENDFLHIPTGSRHGVNVDEGNTLHYIWIDIFRNLEDMSWIKEHHIGIDD